MNANCCRRSTNPCDSTIAERPRYYPRQLITPDDLTLEQNYFRDRMRRHNRLLHGWGVVCGGVVCPVATTNADGTTSFTPWQVKVQQGYVLGPYGDEIILDCSRTVDLRTTGISGVAGEPSIDAPDPWCSQVFTPPSTTNVLYIAVKYKQAMTRPVRVQPVGCGCDNTSCEYSRWRDGYEIGVLQTCPACNACNATALPPPNTQNLATGAIPTCPDCSCGPWVCLAQVTLGLNGTIQQIDNCSCRRLVLSLCNFWWRGTCAGTTTTISGVTSASGSAGTPQVPADGQTQVSLTVSGTNLETGPGVIYSFGPGISVIVTGQTSTLQTGLTSVGLTVTAQATASPGLYNLTVVNPDCSVVVFGNALQVVAPTSGGGTYPGGPAGGSGPAGSAAPSTPAKPAATPASAGDQPTMKGGTAAPAAPTAAQPGVPSANTAPETPAASSTPAAPKRAAKTTKPPAEKPPGS
ncbi:MAG: hypothetical protein ACRD2B_06000 [Terriglobia bacterium]